MARPENSSYAKTPAVDYLTKARAEVGQALTALKRAEEHGAPYLACKQVRESLAEAVSWCDDARQCITIDLMDDPDACTT